MCGIAGILNFKERIPREEAIRKMTNRLAHRGPDAEGIYVDDFVALGHRRLSIIDVSEASNQPMWDHSRRYAITFNGEIYNYQELRHKLPNYPYKTQSDTEVILAYYETYGTACLSHLNGMFAFALWDSLEKRLFVARDRVGKKPFYYFLSDQYFLFSSEIRSLLASGLINAKLDELHLAEFFKYQASMDQHTLVKGIQQLHAGSYALIENGKFTEKKYWGYDEIKPSEDDPATTKTKVKDLFIDAVRLRMVSDVPLGVFLSGGIDSSLVVACMAELSTQPVNTINISFDEKKFDESGYADQIAKQYNTRHHRIVIRPDEFLKSMDEILAAMDTPSGDGPNTYLVSKYTKKENIKVALSGLGGDELFAGYNKFMIYHKLMQNKWILNVPSLIRHSLAKMILSAGHGYKFNKLGYLLKLKEWDVATVYPILRGAYSNEEIKSILSGPIPEDRVEQKLAEINKHVGWMGSFSMATIGEMETYTRDVLLRDTDQMSMTHGLEVRVPFFDYRLIEYVLSLPDSIKYPHTPKQLLVESLAPRLPKEIVNIPKMGFTLPWEHWLKNELSDMVQHRINYIAHRPEFNGEAIQKKWNAFRKGDSGIMWSRIWKLVVLSDWLERNKL
jgi:asparagine synthase (glutamine-hydrolysing)